MERLRSVAWLVVIATLGACPGASGGTPEVSEGVPAVLRDRTGAEFEVVGGDLDQIRPLDEALLEDIACPAPLDSIELGEAAFWVGEAGLPMVCLTEPEGGGPFDCRPLACDAVAECPPGAACVRGVCHYAGGQYEVEPARVDDLEVLALCAAELPWGLCMFADAGYARVAALVSAACEDTPDGLCEVPAECAP